MCKLKKIPMLLMMLISMMTANAQDPSFSQFFSSPLNVNPALTGSINGKWRVMSNYRTQWIGPGYPYQTGTISADSKIFQNVPGNFVDENTRVGVGGMFMYDQAMSGVLKSNYGSFNLSGNIRLADRPGYEGGSGRVRHNSKIKMDGGSAEQRIGVGLGVIYGHRRLDYSKLDFEEQFTGSGFNTNLPSGESSLTNMKPYLSVSAGLLYSYITDVANLDIGISAFHFNKPRQTFLDDDKQYLPIRYVVHSNLERFIGNNLVLNVNGIYQQQAKTSYFSIGGALGYYLPDNGTEMLLNAGLWYWSKNAVIPYVGFSYGNFQLGLSYDVTISKLKEAPNAAKTFELCLILRGEGKKSGVIPAPWR